VSNYTRSALSTLQREMESRITDVVVLLQQLRVQSYELLSSAENCEACYLALTTNVAHPCETMRDTYLLNVKDRAERMTMLLSASLRVLLPLSEASLASVQRDVNLAMELLARLTDGVRSLE
jgi:hypothetical protein